MGHTPKKKKKNRLFFYLKFKFNQGAVFYLAASKQGYVLDVWMVW